MISIPLNEPSKTISVPFYGSDLYIVNYNGEPYVPMRPIVEGMGLNWKSQLTKLKQRFNKGIVISTIPTKCGSRSMICLALRKLTGWLTTIYPNKVKPEIRDKVIRYQGECDDVLYEYWTKEVVKAKEQTPLQQSDFKYIIRMEVYNSHQNERNIFTGGTETPIGIIEGIARRYGYHINKITPLPINTL
ncbi:antirepressor [Xenorhabdus stockiae]|uniref:Antirepressor n=1 Tax=Xenorhabdus stockiae TaxID=351614 RepID=A0A2D0KAL2_9GAMM|nr:antirepressor [Xenorhabdus stockiae]